MFIDYYELLKIPPDASIEEIKKAYRGQVTLWHPDKNAGIDTTEKMQLINEAYLILKDAEARERYNVEHFKYKKFYSTKKQERTYSAKYKSGNERKTNFENESKEEYVVVDNILKQWIENARKQSVSMANEMINEMKEMSKASITSASSAMLKYCLAYISVGLFLSFLFALFRAC